MEYTTKSGTLLRHTLNKPFLWSLILPLLIIDIFAIFYNQTGFRICGIPRVKRSNYVRIDRHKLRYLTPYQKLQCVYCGYANGVLMFCSELGVRLERYWCGIQHERVEGFIAPPHHAEFLEFGDERAFQSRFGRR